MSTSNGITIDMQVASMKYRELQSECKKAGLPATGKTEELRQRLLGRLSQKREIDKKAGANEPLKHNKKSPSDDLTCPITLELPFEPVIAEDGRVYERWAIMSHFKRHPTDLRSPVTNEAMGRRLFPAIQIENHIKTLIETGAITGDLASGWKKKEGESREVEDLKKRAEGGDSDAMFEVGCFYCFGEKGMAKDSKLAYTWYKKAADADNVKAMTNVGVMLLEGEGVEQNVALGFVLTTMAAERGSDLACYILGMCFATGEYGVPADTVQGIRWFRKALSGDCVHQGLPQEGIADVRSKLQELEGNKASETLA